MSEKTLNFLIKLFLLITTGGFLLIVSDHGELFVKYIFMIAFFITPLLLMLKIISRFFLTGFKGYPVWYIEKMFTLFYFLLTKEARDEWVDYIRKQKQKSI